MSSLLNTLSSNIDEHSAMPLWLAIIALCILDEPVSGVKVSFGFDVVDGCSN